MSIGPVLLMEPGPTLVDPRVVAAVSGPPVHHLSAGFIETVDNLTAGLAELFGVEGQVVILPASGRAGIEAVMASVPLAQRSVVVPTNGTFGRLMCRIGRSLGRNVVEIPFPDGTPIDPDAVGATVRREEAALLCVVHCESSTGMLNDLTPYGAIARASDALLLVDAIASLGGTELSCEQLEIDFCVSAPQKALGAFTGLSLVGIGPRGLDALSDRRGIAGTSYLDLRRWWELWLPAEVGGRAPAGARRFPFSMPSNLVLALNAAVAIIREEETLSARGIRHAQAMEAFRAGAEVLGCELLCAPAHAAPTLTAVAKFPGRTPDEVRRGLRVRHGIEVAGGLDGLAGRLVRVGHMAESARPEPLLRTLGALGMELGGRRARDEAVDAFSDVWSPAA